MKTNKPEVVMTLPGGEQLIRLSDYEALKAEHESCGIQKSRQL